MSHTEECKIEDGKLINETSGKVNFIITELTTKGLTAKHLNVARGYCRKPRGKKIYCFIVKKDGGKNNTALVVV